jgi:hypothetical protein
MENVPLPGTESFVADSNAPVNHYLTLSVRRRDLEKAKRKLDAAIWAAHKAGVTTTLIAQANDCTRQSIQDRLRRIRREREAARRELEQ